MTADDPGPRSQTPARAWFARRVTDVARGLLGCYLTSLRDDGEVTVRISEVEAYGGADDPGSHAYRGRTARNAAMFGEPGRLYVYRHLGLHHCANVVAHLDGEASAAVLLRGGEVVSGVGVARARRDAVGTVSSDAQLASGPGRLAVCLALDLADDGADVTRPGGPVVLELGEPVGPVGQGPRVGVSGPGGDEQLYPWRWWLTGDPTVSAYRRAYRKPASAARSG